MKIRIFNLLKKHTLLYILRLFLSFFDIFSLEFLEWLTNHQFGGWLNATSGWYSSSSYTLSYMNGTHKVFH